MAFRSNLEDGRLDEVRHWSKFRMMPLVITIGATFTVDEGMPPVLLINPGASGRTILMPAATAARQGIMFWIRHAGATAATDLTVNDSTNVTTFGIIGKGQMALLWCDGSTW